MIISSKLDRKEKKTCSHEEARHLKTFGPEVLGRGTGNLPLEDFTTIPVAFPTQVRGTVWDSAWRP